MSTDSAWIEVLAAHRAERRPVALVVVTGVKGSTPREVGARMLVAEGRIVWGTIGGGQLEHLAVQRAQALLESTAPAPERVEVPLAESAGQCCGGSVTLLVEPYAWHRRTVAIFGAGHVGQALAGLGPWLQADVRVIDPRPLAELVPAPPSDRTWTLVHESDPTVALHDLPESAAVVVMTHSHPLDLELLATALRRGPFAYLGLIGSERKWDRFRAQLTQRGFDAEALARVTCPIGVTRDSKAPSAIALSVATQLSGCFAAAPTG